MKKFLFLLFLIFPAVLFSQNLLYEQAVEKSIFGDTEGAVKDLEALLSSNPEHKDAIELLAKLYTQLAEEEIKAGNYKRGLFYIKKAKSISRFTDKMTKLEALAKEATGKPAVGAKRQKKKLIKKQKPSLRRVEKIIIEKYIPAKKDKLKNISITGTILSALLLLVAIVLLGKVRGREERIVGETVKIARMLSSQEVEAGAKLNIQLPDGKERIVTDIDTRIRARADSIEVLGKIFDDPEVALEMLTPFLSDANNRVRANAAKAIFRHNPQLALDTLRKMTENEDRWMRLSSAWALGQVGGKEAAQLLEKLLDDKDHHVSKRARKSLEKLAEGK